MLKGWILACAITRGVRITRLRAHRRENFHRWYKQGSLARSQILWTSEGRPDSNTHFAAKKGNPPSQPCE
jgi:hypothetical protein